MKLFETLEKKQQFTDFDAGAENRFFISRSATLNSSETFHNLSRAQKPFDIIRANIVIRAFLNKKKLEEVYHATSRIYRKNGKINPEGEIAIRKAMDEVKVSLPYLKVGHEYIYVPVLSKSLNLIYDKDILRFEEKPVRTLLGAGFETVLVDPFDTYGWKIFDSYFTNLIKVKEVRGTAAFFDYDSLSIYIVNSQGRLDVKISLFDRALGKHSTNHMMERVLPVVDAYFRDDREGLMKKLVENQLISSSLIYKISSDEKKLFSNIERQIEK